MEAYIVKDPERAMSNSIACRTYFDGLLILVTAFLISSCSTTDFASLQPREGLDAATRDNVALAQSCRPRQRALHRCRVDFQRKSKAPQTRLDVSDG